MNAKQRWTEQSPRALGKGPLPIESFTSAEGFEKEKQRIFRKSWLNVGREEEIALPGDYTIVAVPSCDTSLVLARDRKGKLHAFHNMCSHRGNKLVWDAEGTGGNAGALVCKFHGWAYGLDGQLTHVTDEGEFFDLDKRRHGLTEVPLDTWQGFIFVNFDPHPAHSLLEYLGEIPELLAGYPFERLKLSTRYLTEINANWRVIADAFHEGYHAPFVHRTSLMPSFLGGMSRKETENPMLHGLHYGMYGPHFMSSIYGDPSHEPSPVAKLSARFGPNIEPRKLEMLAANKPKGINPTGATKWAFDIYMLFPNFNLGLRDGTYRTYNFWPITPERTLFEFRTYYEPPTNAAMRFSREYVRVVHRDVVVEDLSTLERTQEMLKSGAKSEFLLSDQEVLCRYFNSMIMDVVDGRCTLADIVAEGNKR